VARAPLEAIRDEWLRPLIDQLREAERTIGRVEAERDHAIRELGAVRDELAVLKVPGDAPRTQNAAPLRSDGVETDPGPCGRPVIAWPWDGGAGGGG
jgi:hypothetical protein